MRSAQRIALIGYGAVAQAVLRNLAKHEKSVEVLGVLRRQKQATPVRLFDSVDELLSLKPDLVVECAGQGAVVQYAERIVSAGVDLMTISMGAFADSGLLERTRAAAAKTGAQVIIPGGAVGALDVLSAVRH